MGVFHLLIQFSLYLQGAMVLVETKAISKITGYTGFIPEALYQTMGVGDRETWLIYVRITVGRKTGRGVPSTYESYYVSTYTYIFFAYYAGTWSYYDHSLYIGTYTYSMIKNIKI